MKSTIRWAPPYSPGLLLGLALAAMAAYALLRWRSGRPIATARRPVLLALRLAILAMVAAIAMNPVRVDEAPGPVERPKVFYLLDASQSMAIGQGEATRWDRAIGTIREADRARDPRLGARVGLFRFGSHLASIPAEALRPASDGAPPPEVPPPSPTDPETFLAAPLEGLTDRFGQEPPQAVVVFSDGRARDPDRVDAIARAYSRMKVPIHVVPAGEPGVGGDVAIVAMVAPGLVRKSSKVAAQVFVRSFGYRGRRTEVRILAGPPGGPAEAVLARVPVVLEDGLKGYTMAIHTGDKDRRIEARIDPQPGEVSTANNAFAAEMAIDHTKIRVLYLEGSPGRYIDQSSGSATVRNASTPLGEALAEDRDVDCTAVATSRTFGGLAFPVRREGSLAGLPEFASELFAYDAIILSNVATGSLDPKYLGWIEEWVGRRGGGLLMVGGPSSLASGGWGDTPIAGMLPVEVGPVPDDWSATATAIRPAVPASGPVHPIWQLTSDEPRNRELLRELPRFGGGNRLGAVKPAAEILARDDGPAPAIVSQPFGRGRTMVMSTAITPTWADEFVRTWGGPGSPCYKKFWRNVVYWLSENSSTGRRRLIAATDKRLYRPGESIALGARAFDEDASPTIDYRVAVTVEPRTSAEPVSDDSPVRRPTAAAAEPGAPAAPLLPWSEEFEMDRLAATKTYAATLPIADAKSLPPAAEPVRGLRFELTAYEGQTQVDSSSIEVQILDDPAEQQDPMPDHDLLRRLAEGSGGKVLTGPDDLSATLAELPRVVGPPEITTTPAWSRWPLLAALIALLAIEWAWRRHLGLA